MSSDPNSPDLSHNIRQAVTRLAANHARVVQAVEGLAPQIDQLVAATVRHDWNEVGRLSWHMAVKSRSGGYRALSAMAQKLYDETTKPANDLGIRRSLIRLIGTCGRTGPANPAS
jgi:hypothetical protein